MLPHAFSASDVMSTATTLIDRSTFTSSTRPWSHFDEAAQTVFSCRRRTIRKRVGRGEFLTKYLVLNLDVSLAARLRRCFVSATSDSRAGAILLIELGPRVERRI